MNDAFSYLLVESTHLETSNMKTWRDYYFLYTDIQCKDILNVQNKYSEGGDR